MILGVIIGKFADNVEGVLKGATLEGVSVREFGSLGLGEVEVWRRKSGADCGVGMGLRVAVF